VATADAGPLTPIAGLHPYVGSKWKIKARLTLKGDIRKFTNARGEGQLLKLELTDASGEMSVTLFGKAVDKFNPVLHPGKVYFFSKGRIQAANPRYDKGSYVATLEEHSIIELAEDDDRSIPAVQYKFMALWDVDQSADTNMQLDVKGVICNVEDPFTITTRATQEQRTKREITLWDDSGPDASSTIVVTIWGDRAFDEFEAGTVGFFRGCRVNEWQGRKSLNSNGQYELNPDNPEAFRLMGRYDASGRPCASTQPRRTGALATVEEVLAQNLQLGPAPIPGQQLAGGGAKSIQWNSVRVTLIESLGAKAPYYNSCPEMVPMTKKGETQAPDRMRPCRKKVTQDGDRWRCDAGHSCAKPSCRYIFRADFADYSGTMNVSVFDEVGEKIIGCPADELAHFWESASQAEEAQRLLHKAGFAQVVLRTRSQRELWNNEEQVKITADSCSPIDFAGAGRQMLAEVMASI
jgi:replication factor A1